MNVFFILSYNVAGLRAFCSKAMVAQIRYVGELNK